MLRFLRIYIGSTQVLEEILATLEVWVLVYRLEKKKTKTVQWKIPDLLRSSKHKYKNQISKTILSCLFLYLNVLSFLNLFLHKLQSTVLMLWNVYSSANKKKFSTILCAIYTPHWLPYDTTFCTLVCYTSCLQHGT